MNLRSFLDFVEIRTKVASVIPFVLGLLFTYYRYNEFKWENTLVFFISLITLDMATTAINHYEGFKKGEDYNPVEDRDIPRGTAISVIALLLAVSIAAGLLLVYRTDYLILTIGVISMGIAVLYSFGPVPISGTPFGELASGGLMGFVIFFIASYIQVFDAGFIAFSFKGGILAAHVNLREILPVVLVSLPLVFMIANIMLANNICDVESDIKNGRYTLPQYLGRKASVSLWIILYCLAYLVIAAAVVIKVLPLFSLLVLFSLIPNIKLVREFAGNQDKRVTFANSIKVFMTASGLWILSFLLQFVFKGFL
ncbi:MAG: UbiA family prenyltransferase [Spirochaetales bacterium]|nr:UbiA family prenyltransferase [Spirochaetales bacterium]